MISLRVATTAETIEAKITIDGVAYSMSGVSFTANTNYWLYFNGGAGDSTSAILIRSTTRQTFLPAPTHMKAIKIEMRKTTAAGTGTFFGKPTYSQYA